MSPQEVTGEAAGEIRRLVPDVETLARRLESVDYLIPTSLETPDFELGETVTPCPHHPLGAKGVGESPNVGSPPAIVNAVIDALHETHGVDHIDMPCTPARVWAAMQGRPEPPQ